MDKRPIHSVASCEGSRACEFEQREINKLLDLPVIEPAQTECASPIGLAPKEDGTLCFCDESSGRNAVNVCDVHPIRQMEEGIDTLGNETIFSTHDPRGSYWHLEIAPEDCNKTALTSHHGLFRLTQTPFGLKNSPGTLQ